MRISTIKEYLALIGELAKQRKSIEAFVLEHGREFNIISPAKYPRGKAKECFANSVRLALSNPTLTYCEGYGASILPLHHGWCVALHHGWCVDAHGNVVDVTPSWEKCREYYGVPFKTDYVRKHILRTGFFSLLDDWQAEDGHPFELVRGNVKPIEFLRATL